MKTTNTERPEGLPLLPVAEVLLAVVTVATVAGMWRLFADATYFLPLAGHAVAAHALAAALRRRGVAPAPAALVCGAVAVLTLTWAHLRDTTSYGFPTGETLQAAADQLELAWRTFGDVRAPAPVLTGFLLTAGVAVWIGAWLADVAAFRLWTPFEALIPSGTLFIFASLFSAERARVLAAVLWLTAALAFVLLHRTARQQTSPSWLGSDARIGSRALVKAGVGLSLLAVSAAWLVGPRLPGATADALVPYADRDEAGSRITISPLVEIRGRLVEQSAAELFTVTASERQYWRLTSLDIFDGDVWSSRGSFGDADGGLPGSGIEGVPTTEVTQTFNILDLAAIWLPAAFEAGRMEIDEAEVRWDDVSSTLIVSTDLDDSDGLIYEVVSDVPDFDPEVLGAAPADEPVPDEVSARSLDLPDDFPQAVVDLAQEAVAAETSPYGQALALQNFFRDGSFTYSLDAPSGHSDTAIEGFLFDTRTGYCEQFAGTYAAMARAVGLPSRVAVGFTPGDPDPSTPARYIVRGEHAHAWPEVWLAGAGWVAFEPTPGRGQPGAEAYTGVPESQDTAGPSTEATTVPVDPAQPGGEGEGAVPSTTDPSLTDVGAEPEAFGADGDADDALPVFRILGWGMAGIAGAVLLGAAAVAGGRAFARWRRRARAGGDDDAMVDALWQEAVEAGPVVGVVRRPFETRTELGRRLTQGTGDPGAGRLAALATRAAFDPVGVDEEAPTQARELLAGVRAAIHLRTTRWARLRAAVDPRPPRRRGPRGARPAAPRIHISGA